MYGDLETAKKYWKLFEFETTKVDKKLCNKGCFVSHVTLVSDGGGAADAILRDGHDTGGETKITLSATTSGRDNRPYSMPVHFRKGLFVDVGSNVKAVEVQFLIDKEKD